MSMIKSLCVYCGSGRGSNPEFLATAQAFGRQMAERGIRLVYGGGSNGLMGAVADAVLDGGGRVLGIIPEHLQAAEIGHPGLTELVVVDSMHTRKRLMFEAADGFVILPGGLGTLDEFFEIVTWRQLHLHDKPVVVLDVAGYWRKLIDLVDSAIAHGFARPSARRHFSVASTIGRVFDLLALPADSLAPDRPDRL